MFTDRYNRRENDELKERPYRVGLKQIRRDSNYDYLLPTSAINSGFELHSLEFNIDPFVLYDRYGNILHEWDCGYKPHWTEVYEVCRKYTK